MNVSPICMDILPHGRFAPQTFRPALDILPHGRFAPQTFRPALDISPHGQFAHIRFAPWSWGESLWANRLWGEMSSVVRNVHGANRPYMERNVHGANCPCGEKSINRQWYTNCVCVLSQVSYSCRTFYRPQCRVVYKCHAWPHSARCSPEKQPATSKLNCTTEWDLTCAVYRRLVWRSRICLKANVCTTAYNYYVLNDTVTTVRVLNYIYHY